MQATKQNKIFPLFLSIILCITVIRIVILTAHIWPVNGDEVQYWNWAKHAAWGYYSKPPMVAWLIAVSTSLFGNSITAIRLAAPLAHSITAVIIFFIARDLYSNASHSRENASHSRENASHSRESGNLNSEKIGLWAGLIYLLAPGVTVSSTLISTDPPLLMFWSMAFYCFIRAIQNNVETLSFPRKRESVKKIPAFAGMTTPASSRDFWWCGLGITLGFAMLSKYAALFFIISMLCYFLIEKEQRCNLFKPGFYLALLIAMLILLPNIVWNSHHAFASVLAVKDNADLQGQLFNPMHLLKFLTAQFGLINPIVFAFLLIFIVQPKVWCDKNARLLLAFIIPVFVVMSFEGLLVRAHSNWAAPMYIAAVILVSAELIKRHRNYLLVLVMLLNLLVIIGFVNIQALVRYFHIDIHKSTSIVNWHETGKAIMVLQKQYPDAKLLVDERMLLTEIMYFGRFDLINSFKWNPQHQLHGQYDLVTHLDGEIGKNFLLFTYHSSPVNITQRFNQTKPLATLQLEALDGRSLPLYVFYLKDFKGYA